MRWMMDTTVGKLLKDVSLFTNTLEIVFGMQTFMQ